jgi:hypothetical protein
MTFADPIEDDAIQYRGVIIQRQVSVGGTWQAPLRVPILMEYPRDSVALATNLRWLPHHEEPDAFQVRATRYQTKQPSVQPPKEPRPARPAPIIPPWCPSRFTRPADQDMREWIIVNPSSAIPIHLRLTRGSREIAFIPTERGAQILARLRVLGLTRCGVGHWSGGSQRLREIRFFSLSQFPTVLKFQVYLQTHRVP